MDALAQGSKKSSADSASILDENPYSNSSKRFYLIEWNGDGCSGKNHYMAGTPPFDLLVYKSWLEMAGFVFDSLNAVRVRQEISIG